MFSTIMLVFAFVLFVIATLAPWAPVEPHRLKLIAAGLAFWVMALLGPAMLK
jgi:hypothetical protein